MDPALEVEGARASAAGDRQLYFLGFREGRLGWLLGLCVTERIRDF